MKIKYYTVDTFTNKIFSGNPACVCLLPNNTLNDLELQKIACENNLPVTAFLIPENSQFSIRWFTVDNELDLCGHGTLAAAYVLFNHMNIKQNEFQLNSPKAGLVNIRQEKDIIELNFPAKEITKIQSPELLIKGLRITPLETYQHWNERILAILKDELSVKNLNPDFEILKFLQHKGIIVTAPSTKIDFVSRTFYPKKVMPEDAVTGASHCLLVPYWAKQLGKLKLHTHQLSKRGGELFCELKDDSVLIGGRATLYSEGTISI